LNYMGIINNKRLNSLKKNNLVSKKQVKYSLNFISLISPFSLKSNRLNKPISNSGIKKLVVKQSYMLVSWLSYLTKIIDNSSSSELQKDDFKKKNSNLSRPGFFVQPVRVYKTTMTKSPMAHKTFSQEQYLLKFYKLSISFSFPKVSNIKPFNLNQSLYTLLSFRFNNFSTNTNLFFLKRSQLSINSGDLKFFQKLIYLD